MLEASTFWTTYKRGAGEIYNPIKALGITNVVLDFRTTSEEVAGFEQLLIKGTLEKVTGVFFPVPMPPGIAKEAFKEETISFSDPEATGSIERAIDRTFESRVRLKFDFVIVNLGAVEMNLISRQLMLQYPAIIDSEIWKLRVKEMVKVRRERRRKYLATALKNLEKLLDRAQKEGVRVLIKNRLYYEEIPTFEETEVILENFGGDVGFCYDVGYAKIQENIKVAPHHLYWLHVFERYLDCVLLHDVNGVTPHLAPSSGEIDFLKITGYLKPSTHRVLHIGGDVKPVDAARAKTYLEGLGF